VSLEYARQEIRRIRGAVLFVCLVDVLAQRTNNGLVILYQVVQHAVFIRQPPGLFFDAG
jgi:hypothetical protein